MVQQLRACIILKEDPCLISSIYKVSQTPVSPAPGNLPPFSDLGSQTHKHT